MSRRATSIAIDLVDEASGVKMGSFEILRAGDLSHMITVGAHRRHANKSPDNLSITSPLRFGSGEDRIGQSEWESSCDIRRELFNLYL